MKGDTLDRILTFGLAYAVVFGGGYILLATYTVPTADKLQLVIAGFIGGALTWAFNKEVQKQTARQQERALLTTPNGTTYTATSPDSVTVTTSGGSPSSEGATT